MLTTRVPLRDTEGVITGIVGVSHDITDERRTQASLRQARDELETRVEERTADLAVANVSTAGRGRRNVRRLRRSCSGTTTRPNGHASESAAILDATGEAMILISPEHWVLSVNRRFTEFFGLRQSEVLGNRVQDVQSSMERIFEDPSGLIALITASTADVEQEFVQSTVQDVACPARAGVVLHTGSHRRRRASRSPVRVPRRYSRARSRPHENGVCLPGIARTANAPDLDQGVRGLVDRREGRDPGTDAATAS